jgi:hypothetical protein
MDKAWLAILGVIFVTLAIVPARANTDYRCLHDCMAGGASGRSCLVQCTYVPIQKQPSAPSIPGQGPTRQSPNAQFDAPIPIPTDQITAPPNQTAPPYATPQKGLSPTTAPLGPSTNFQCMNTCTQQGYQHDYCLEACSY